MKPERHIVTITTDGAGAGTGYTPYVSGRVLSIRYIKTDYDNGVSVAVTAEATGEAIWSEAAVNASATRAPRQATHSVLGAAALYAAEGAAVQDYITVAADRVKIVVASGGATNTGAFHVVIG